MFMATSAVHLGIIMAGKEITNNGTTLPGLYSIFNSSEKVVSREKLV